MKNKKQLEPMEKLEKFVFNLEWATQLEEMTLEEKGIVLENLINYASGLPLNTSNRLVNSVWKGWEPDIDRMTNNYITSVNNGKKGGAPKGTKPWNKGLKKVTNSEPNANPKQTDIEPEAKGEQTYKYNYNYNYKSEIELEVKDKVIEQLDTNTETNTGINTRTREDALDELFLISDNKTEPDFIYHNLTPELQKLADEQAAKELEKLLNK